VLGVHLTLELERASLIMESVKLYTNNAFTNLISKTATKQRTPRMRHFLEDRVARWLNTLMQAKPPSQDRLTFQLLQISIDRCIIDLNFI
jgi:hypothetical protein